MNTPVLAFTAVRAETAVGTMFDIAGEIGAVGTLNNSMFVRTGDVMVSFSANIAIEPVTTAVEAYITGDIIANICFIDLFATSGTG